MDKKRVKWVCPHCNHLHFWYWEIDDIYEGEANMNCDNCHKKSLQMMYVDPISGNAWCEVIKNTMTELEQLKEQAKKIQQKIDYLEEVEKQKKENISLHNVIAKWEFYYSERLDNRRTEYLRGVEKGLSYRDILEEEIENLLKQIEGWIDDQLSFDKTTYTPEYFIGWDECKKKLKSKLRGPCDFYEISKVNNHYE